MGFVFPPTKTQVRLDGDPHTFLSLPLPRLPLRSESATSSNVVPLLPPGPSAGALNTICVIVMGCVLDSASDVHPFSLALEAFLSDSINLDIMRGKSLFQKIMSASERRG